MADTTVSDFVIWAKHIHGDARLAERVLAMREGETLTLRVDGVVGAWRKMDDGKDGRPTPGIRPLGRAQAFWRELFKTRRGDVVRIELADEGAAHGGVAEGAGRGFVSAPEAGRLARSQSDRKAALAALLDGEREGWRSEGRVVSRDELHER